MSVSRPVSAAGLEAVTATAAAAGATTAVPDPGAPASAWLALRLKQVKDATDDRQVTVAMLEKRQSEMLEQRKNAREATRSASKALAQASTRHGMVIAERRAQRAKRLARLWAESQSTVRKLENVLRQWRVASTNISSNNEENAEVREVSRAQRGEKGKVARAERRDVEEAAREMRSTHRRKRTHDAISRAVHGSSGEATHNASNSTTHREPDGTSFGAVESVAQSPNMITTQSTTSSAIYDATTTDHADTTASAHSAIHAALCHSPERAIGSIENKVTSGGLHEAAHDAIHRTSMRAKKTVSAQVAHSTDLRSRDYKLQAAATLRKLRMLNRLNKKKLRSLQRLRRRYKRRKLKVLNRLRRRYKRKAARLQHLSPRRFSNESAYDHNTGDDRTGWQMQKKGDMINPCPRGMVRIKLPPGTIAVETPTMRPRSPYVTKATRAPLVIVEKLRHDEDNCSEDGDDEDDQNYGKDKIGGPRAQKVSNSVQVAQVTPTGRQVPAEVSRPTTTSNGTQVPSVGTQVPGVVPPSPRATSLGGHVQGVIRPSKATSPGSPGPAGHPGDHVRRGRRRPRTASAYDMEEVKKEDKAVRQMEDKAQQQLMEAFKAIRSAKTSREQRAARRKIRQAKRLISTVKVSERRFRELDRTQRRIRKDEKLLAADSRNRRAQRAVQNVERQAMNPPTSVALAKQAVHNAEVAVEDARIAKSPRMQSKARQVLVLARAELLVLENRTKPLNRAHELAERGTDEAGNRVSLVANANSTVPFVTHERNEAKRNFEAAMLAARQSLGSRDSVARPIEHHSSLDVAALGDAAREDVRSSANSEKARRLRTRPAVSPPSATRPWLGDAIRSRPEASEAGLAGLVRQKACSAEVTGAWTGGGSHHVEPPTQLGDAASEVADVQWSAPRQTLALLGPASPAQATSASHETDSLSTPFPIVATISEASASRRLAEEQRIAVEEERTARQTARLLLQKARDEIAHSDTVAALAEAKPITMAEGGRGE
eukprot:TRINITY_DN9265_c0_g2_i1.p1 TRINITY_DN9265_c0_g2~~TRINITY_DN9265_c0_g2_i1.p1  ORF type:complete len:1123 (-),score=171.52 TRINITY_DN9265_c0_g2_i1:327-3329(-)